MKTRTMAYVSLFAALTAIGAFIKFLFPTYRLLFKLFLSI